MDNSTTMKNIQGFKRKASEKSHPRKYKTMVIGDSHAKYWATLSPEFANTFHKPRTYAIPGACTANVRSMLEHQGKPNNFRRDSNCQNNHIDDQKINPRLQWPNEETRYDIEQIVLSVGTNDVTNGKTNEKIMDEVAELTPIFKEQFPNARLYWHGPPIRNDWASKGNHKKTEAECKQLLHQTRMLNISAVINFAAGDVNFIPQDESAMSVFANPDPQTLAVKVYDYCHSNHDYIREQFIQIHQHLTK